MKLFIIECRQGAALSTWDEPTPLNDILDRYYEQYLDQTDDEQGQLLTREDFTAEMFQDLWECDLVEV